MVNIQDTCCLDINFDDREHTIHYGQDVYPADTTKVSLHNLKPTLLNKSLMYPEVVYEVHRQVFRETDRNIINEGFSFDLITLPPGLLGIEFIKTHIYYAPYEDNKFSTAVEVQYGVLTVIMQKNKPKGELDFDTSVEEGVVVKLRKGEKLAVPTGYYYTFINTEDEPVLFVRIYKKNGVFDYSFLKRENGLAYYCIRKNARQEIVHNPLYKDIPEIKKVPANSFLEKLGISPNKSLYDELVAHTESFINALWG
jgi:oxalate decarboxylase/phosphoglucose isomerase-like protein (cupin superfamily)